MICRCPAYNTAIHQIHAAVKPIWNAQPSPAQQDTWSAAAPGCVFTNTNLAQPPDLTQHYPLNPASYLQGEFVIFKDTGFQSSIGFGHDLAIDPDRILFDLTGCVRG